jgi:hypothetical protein
VDHSEAQENVVLERISLKMRMELARIIDPRHDRDPDVVMAEIRQIAVVLASAMQETLDYAKITLDTNRQAGVHSAPAAAAQEAHDDAEAHHTAPAGDSATATHGKRKRSQVPL